MCDQTKDPDMFSLNVMQTRYLLDGKTHKKNTHTIKIKGDLLKT